MTAPLLLGTAGWSLPRASQHRFPDGPSHLARYATVFDAVEINSTFHRPHRASTFARWAGEVPPGFAFSVKLPRAITHEQRLVAADVLVDVFLEELAPLGERVRCLLVQLPPSLAFDAPSAGDFLAHLRGRFAGEVALEPRHETWFARQADRLLVAHRVARVGADPPRVPRGLEPGGWPGFAYFRLHGSPRVYYSAYEAPFLDAMATRIAALRAAGVPTWCIFDNTTLGAGTDDALQLRARL